MEFFWGRRYDFNVPRGPFKSSYHWLDSYIDLIIQDKTAEMMEAEDDDDKEEAEYTIEVLNRFRDLLPRVFPEILSPAERETYLPNMIKGDLASLRQDVREYYESKGVPVIRDPDQYSTDLGKCVKSLADIEREQGAEKPVRMKL